MSFLQSILLGIIQGLTEFLPVSSSGHLVLAGHIFGIEEKGDIIFETFLHLGTALAVIVYFRSMLWDLIKSLFCWKKTIESQVHFHNRMTMVYLGIATFTTLLMYLPFSDRLEHMFTQPLLVAFMLIITGIIIFVSDFIKDRGIPVSSMGIFRSIFIGIGQGIALLPGISRSGTTIACSIFTGIKRKEAAHFSFLLSIPAILGGNLLGFKELASLDKSMLLKYIAGFCFSFAVGFAVIAILIELIRRSKLKYFSYYLWTLSTATIAFFYLA
ncbi:MAG: undecaprenyl-diphosphate phosphatase [Candidatus Cloacimonetes bacterium]|nr:undecaprenyl-diphosphate phosphatase [Candidatus Cloacimonadota bacterium]